MKLFNCSVVLCGAVVILLSISQPTYGIFCTGDEKAFTSPGGQWEDYIFILPIGFPNIDLPQFNRPLPPENIGPRPDIGQFLEGWTEPVEVPEWRKVGMIIDELGNAYSIPYINVRSENFSTDDTIFIDVWKWFSDSGQKLVSATYTVIDNVIDVEIVIQDLHGSGLGFTQAFTGEGGTVELKDLVEGRYTVNANIYVMPYGGGEASVYDLGSTVFDVIGNNGEFSSMNVIPEPGTVLLFGLGGLALLRKRSK